MANCIVTFLPVHLSTVVLSIFVMMVSTKLNRKGKKINESRSQLHTLERLAQVLVNAGGDIFTTAEIDSVG